MDKRVKKKIEEKINETFVKTDEILQIIKSLQEISKQNSFEYGILIGRLYNSFYYQCRRILKRSPTKQEFSEFLDLLKQHEFQFLNKFDFNKK